MNLIECAACHRHHLAQDATCPFCDGAGGATRAVGRTRARLTGAVMTALTPVVLAACYGVGGIYVDTGAGDDTLDLDGDGYAPAEGDCDDENGNVHPDATEVCDDEVDNDCNDLVDIQDPVCADGSDTGAGDTGQ